MSARDSQVMTDSKHMTLTATQQHLNEIDTPETIMIISFEWTAAHSSILWRVMDHQSRHGSSRKKHLEKNNTFVWSTRLPVSLMMFYVWLMRIPTKVVASIFKVKHFTTFGKTSSWHAYAVTWVLHKILGNMIVLNPKMQVCLTMHGLSI